MTDQVVEAKPVALTDEQQEQIKEVAEGILANTAGKELEPVVVFNGISAALTSLLISFTIGGSSELNLEKLGRAFDTFIAGLDQNIRDVIAQIAPQEQPEIPAEQASAIITSV